MSNGVLLRLRRVAGRMRRRFRRRRIYYDVIPAQLEPYVPNDHARQVTATHYVDLVAGKKIGLHRVLDYGCGPGDSVDYFTRITPNVAWVGLDIESSPEVNRRVRTDAQFVTFDGVQIPFDDGVFDLVYSRQVFEHVRYPEQSLREIARVLRPNGYFVGSTSHLENYHTLSFWNYTPYGFLCLLESAGLELMEIRPGIDGLTLFLYRLMGWSKFFDRFFSGTSPLNLVIDVIARGLRRMPYREVNSFKLLFCGHFCFMARRPG